MDGLSLNEKIAALGKLGQYINQFDDRLRAHMQRAMHANPWFTIKSQEHALHEIANRFLDVQLLQEWIDSYNVGADRFVEVGVILAGNIPLVGFHDVLSVFMSGNVAQIKVSDRDPHLLTFLLKKLGEINRGTQKYFKVTDRLADFDAVIATGSNNSGRYFEQYFGKYPHIIRKNRNGVAVLDGKETPAELKSLGTDVFQYFGLGCRNVSHICVPENYDFEVLKDAFKEHSSIVNHVKYRNNFDHNIAIFILNRFPYYDFETVLLVEDNSIISPIGCLYYSYYENVNQIQSDLEEKSNKIQCVVSNIDFSRFPSIPFGKAQTPSLSDYADGIDTMQFLTSM